MENYLTTKQAALFWGVTDARIRQMLASGEMTGEKHAGVWAIYAPGGVPEHTQKALGKCILERWDQSGRWLGVTQRHYTISRAQKRELLAGKTIKTKEGMFRRVDWEERRDE